MTGGRMPHPGASEATGALLADEPVDATVLESERVYEGRVWDVRSDTVAYGDGRIVRQYVDHPGAAAVVAVDEECRVLLIQQYRHPIRLRDWEIPAGLLDVAGEVHAREDEEADIRLEWVPLADVVAGIFAGRLRNGIMTVGVLAAAERLRAEQGAPTP